MKNNAQNEQCEQVKSISKIIQEHNQKNCIEMCKNKLAKILQKDDLDDDDIKLINTLLNVINTLEEKEKCVNKKNPLIHTGFYNTKEEGELLKNLTEGSQNFEDWHILRLLFKIKMIEALLK